MRAKNVPLANKLRALLGDMIEREKVSSDELTMLFDEVIVGDETRHRDSVVNGAKDLMKNYLSREIMSSDEMQVVVDQAINLARVNAGSIGLPSSCSLSIISNYPDSKFKIN